MTYAKYEADAQLEGNLVILLRSRTGQQSYTCILRLRYTSFTDPQPEERKTGLTRTPCAL